MTSHEESEHESADASGGLVFGEFDGKRVLDGTALTLGDWLAIVLSDDPFSVHPWNTFPTQGQLDEYIESVPTVDEDQFKALLRRLLVPSDTYGSDDLAIAMLQRGVRQGPFKEYERRLLLHVKDGSPVWEGTWWILDLLPHFPREALAAVEAFMLARAQQLPDFAFYGLGDALVLIRARYLKSQPARAQIEDLSDRDFEVLVAALYRARGYEVELTPRSKDGGRDVIAERTAVGERERLLISAKRYTGDRKVGKRAVEQIYLPTDLEHATKGVIVTSALAFTKGPKDLAKANRRLELIPYAGLVELLDAAFGGGWPADLDRIIVTEKALLPERQTARPKAPGGSTVRGTGRSGHPRGRVEQIDGERR